MWIPVEDVIDEEWSEAETAFRCRDPDEKESLHRGLWLRRIMWNLRWHVSRRS